MKTKLLILFFAVCQIANAQTWFQQASNTDSTLKDVHFINQDTGFACGASGTFLKTTNGGTTWNVLSSVTTDNLVIVQFLNKDTGFVAGSFNGKLFRTTNSGSTWTNIGLNQPNKYNGGLWFTSIDTGFLAIGHYDGACGTIDSSKIYKTTNGGTTWNLVYLSENWINYFYFVDKNNGYATCAVKRCGSVVVSPAQVLKTIDGGNTWTVANSSFGSNWLSGIYFLNQSTGFVGAGIVPLGSSNIWKTTDGGTNWNVVSTVLGNYAGVAKINFANANIGYAINAVGGTPSGQLLKTTNGGNTWVNETTPRDSLNGVYFTSPTNGFAVGDNGVIIKYGIMTSVNNSSITDNQVKIFPQPFSTQTTLRTANLLINATLTVDNCFGQTVKQIKNINGQTVTLFRDNLPSGLYFIRITQDSKIITADKLVITD